MGERVLHPVGVVLGGNGGQCVALVAKALEIRGRDGAEHARKTRRVGRFFFHIGAAQQGLGDLGAGHGVHDLEAHHQRVAHTAGFDRVHGRPNGGRTGGTGVLKTHCGHMAQARHGHGHQRAGEVLRHEAAVVVAHKHAIDVLRLQACAVQRGLHRIADQLLGIDRVELAKRGMAPANDAAAAHDAAPTFCSSGVVRRKVGKPTPEASKPPSTARNWPLMKLASLLHKKPTVLAISSVLP